MLARGIVTVASFFVIAPDLYPAIPTRAQAIKRMFDILQMPGFINAFLSSK
jgi:hypothetical protein